MRKNKPILELTEEEKNWMNTIAVNYIIAQADGFQQGYAQAISDFTENIVDYWEGTDDKPQQSVIDALVDLGVELGQKQRVAKLNIEKAGEAGYERHYNWEYEEEGKPFKTMVPILTNGFEVDETREDKEDEDVD